MSDIQNALAAYIAREMLRQPKRVIGADEALISSGLIDSFHLVDLALKVEELFGVQIDDSELRAEVFDTLAQLEALIVARRA